MQFIWIEPGTFTMGSPESDPWHDGDEGPQHEVTLTRGFWLGKHEITQEQWEAVLGTRPWAGQGYVQANPRHPAVYISWDDVQQFIGRLNADAGTGVYRLPTEAEWECACRAGTSTRWSFGEDEPDLGDYAWYLDNAWSVGVQYAQPVGTKLPNPWGLFDMQGNVWEWCQDWYGSYPSGAVVDPVGAASASNRVIRGGSFKNNAQNTRSANRNNNSPGNRNNNLGARLLSTGRPARWPGFTDPDPVRRPVDGAPSCAGLRPDEERGPRRGW
ncbi:MAG: formylglycine-generating enzyme family protein [Candidatus Latescibacterota bacterium]